MTTDEFADLVKYMRFAQIQYFKTRAPSDLTTCKKLEKQVDTILAEREQNLQDRLQQKLFD
ncbi:MAG: hypothetical protein NC041_07120 [Bacteroides sp.]|nr:hypothetical protein [Prevotella sp.]MCM1407068.1 hypothetical protein [Treponema brennaborense]MCM1470220.1 hypothetical protein [Bacteroides sp.]